MHFGKTDLENNAVAVSRSLSESESSSTLTNEEESSMGELSPQLQCEMCLQLSPAVVGDAAGAWGQPETAAALEDPAAAAAAPRSQLDIQRSQGAIPKRRTFSKTPDKKSSSQGKSASHLTHIYHVYVEVFSQTMMHLKRQKQEKLQSR